MSSFLRMFVTTANDLEEQKSQMYVKFAYHPIILQLISLSVNLFFNFLKPCDFYVLL